MTVGFFKPSEKCEKLQQQYTSLNKNAWILEQHGRGRCPRGGVNIQLTDEGWLPEQCDVCGEPELRSLNAVLRAGRLAESAKRDYQALLRRETEAWIASKQISMPWKV